MTLWVAPNDNFRQNREHVAAPSSESVDGLHGLPREARWSVTYHTGRRVSMQRIAAVVVTQCILLLALG